MLRLLALLVVILTTTAHAAAPADDVDRGIQLIASGKRVEGVKLLRDTVVHLEAHVKDKPKDAAAQSALAKACWWIAQDDKAFAAVGAAIEAAPKEPDYRLQRARFYRELHKYDQAVEDMRQATKLVPANASIWIEFGATLAMAGQSDSALAAFEKAVKLEPNNVSALYFLGSFHYNSGRTEKGIEWFKKAVKVKPTHYNTNFALGQHYQMKNEQAQALKYFQSAIEGRPDDERALAKLVQCYQALGKVKEREAARNLLHKLHKAGKLHDSQYCREQFTVGQRKVMAWEYFDLTGQFAKRYAFTILDKTGEHIDYTLSLGSYAVTNAIAKEQGLVPKDGRLFHLDYYKANEHRTYGMFKAEPTYDQTRKLVTDIINDKIKPASGTTFFDAAKPEEKPKKKE